MFHRKGIRKIGALMLSALICLPSGPGFALTMTVPAGTPVILKLLEPLDSKTAQTGQNVSLTVVSDIVVKGKVVVQQGAPALGQVTKAKKAGAVGAPGELILSVQTVTAVDGTALPLNLTKAAEGASKMGTSVVLTILCCILFLLKKGENVSFPSGSMFNALTIAPIEIQAKD